MTLNQWIVLGVLGLLVFVILGFGVFTLLPMMNSGELFPTREVLPTATPAPTETFLPTRTPRLPTPTPSEVPYEALIPQGWVEWNVGNAKFWAPSNFIRTDPGTSLLVLVDQNEGPNHFLTTIGLARYVVPDVDMDTYVRENLKALPGYSQSVDLTFLEQKKMDFGPYETVRVKIEAILSNIPGEAAVYVFKDGDNYWLLTCITDYSSYYAWLPKFDQAARTFRTIP